MDSATRPSGTVRPPPVRRSRVRTVAASGWAATTRATVSASGSSGAATRSAHAGRRSGAEVRAITTAGRVARRSMEAGSRRSGRSSASTTTTRSRRDRPGGRRRRRWRRPGRTRVRPAAWGPWAEGNVCPAWVAVSGVPIRGRSGAGPPIVDRPRSDLVGRRPGGADRPGRRSGPRAAARTGPGRAGLRRLHRPPLGRGSVGRWTLDPLGLLAERARSMGLGRHGAGQLRGIGAAPPVPRRLDGGEPLPARRTGSWCRPGSGSRPGRTSGTGPGWRGPWPRRRPPSSWTGRPGWACRWPGWGSAGGVPRHPVGRPTTSPGSRAGDWAASPGRRPMPVTWWWSTSARCGPARWSAPCSCGWAPAWSRSSRRPVPTAPGWARPGTSPRSTTARSRSSSI